MSELLAFAELGFRHITDPAGADHVLFLLVLAAVFRRRDWREALWVVSAFTAGHSVTLLLTVVGALSLPTSLVEFLIPVTIVATGVANILGRGEHGAPRSGRSRVLLVAAFGLVHGAGFATYLRSLFVERIAVPLFGFNLGLEVGQLAVLGAAGLLFAAMDAVLARLAGAGRWAPVRLRTVSVSAAVTLVAARWAVERSPW